MSTTYRWQFVDGDVPGDGQLWLQHQSDLCGFIDVTDAADGTVRRLMVAAVPWVLKNLPGGSGEAVYAAFGAMIVVPEGTPEEIRGLIDLAVLSRAAHFVGTRVESDGSGLGAS